LHELSKSQERGTLVAEEHVISVIIPAFKEGETIRRVIREVKESTSYPTQVIVVDGFSNDGTEEIVKEENAELVRESKKGYGRAIRTGLAHGKGDIIVIIDADNTYDAQDINRLTLPLLKDKVDVCLASRLGGTLFPGSMPGINYVGNRLFTWLFNWLYRQRVSDTQTGFRAIKRNALESFQLKNDGMGISTAMLTKAAKKGLRITEIPTTYRPRNNHSKSKLNPFAAGCDVLRILLFG
jgi:glycosyltransferase involved in cell wall biosynthesis